MKKNYFLLAASTMMFAACAQTDMVNEVVTEEAPQAIEFETFTQKATRTTENSTGTYDKGLNLHHGDFAVWAYKSTSDVLVFDNAEVETTNYTYTEYGTRYWDKTADWYEFYAAAPYSTNPAWEFVGNTTDKDKACFKLTDLTLAATNFVGTTPTTEITEFKGQSGDVDLMIADKCKVVNTYYAGSYKVQLNFIHILSRLNIIVKKSDTAPDNIKLKSVTVKGINLKGSFNEGLVDANGAGKTGRWTPANTPVTTTDYKFTSASGYALTENNDYVLQSFVIPQTVGYEEVKTDGTGLATGSHKPYVEIIYTVNEEIFKAYYNLAAVFGATSTTDDLNTAKKENEIAFNEGYQNTLTITINPENIQFSGNVATWANTPGTATIE